MAEELGVVLQGLHPLHHLAEPSALQLELVGWVTRHVSGLVLQDPLIPGT